MMRRGIPALGFFYRERLDAQRLAHALSEVLSDFEAYAGRFSVQHELLSIVPSNGGVVLEVTQTSELVDALVEAATVQQYERLTAVLSPYLQANGKHPLLAARLTQAPDGSVLTVSWNHAVGDMNSMMLFMRAWSKRYQGLPSEAPFDVEDRQAYLDEHLPDLPAAASCLRVFSLPELIRVAGYVSTRTRRIDVNFGHAEVAALREALGGADAITSGDALTAHVFSVLRQLESAARPTKLVMVVNYRKRLGLPLNMLGNVVGVVSCGTGASDDASRVAAELRAEINAYASRHVDHHATARFKREHSGFFERLRSLPTIVDPDGANFIMSSWANSRVYELAFETTGPVYFSVLMRAPVPFLAGMAETPDQSGLTVSMHLPKNLADRILSQQGEALLRAHQPDYSRRAERVA
jgi:hypothetical protein